MKQAKNTLLISGFLLFILCLGCDNEVDPDIQTEIQITFSFRLPDNATKSNAKLLNNEIAKVLISIENEEDEVIYNRKELTINKFSSEYITSPIALNIGNYKLTEFMAVDTDGEVIYITPIEGSSLSYLVSQALPISFSSTKDELSKINLEVVAADQGSAAEFGYTTVGLSLIKPLNIFVGTYIVDQAAEAGFSFTRSAITISGDGIELYQDSLSIGFNNILIDTTNQSTMLSYTDYRVEISKEGYITFDSIFNNTAFIEFTETPLSVRLAEPSGWTRLGQTIAGSSAEDWFNGGLLNADGNIVIGGTRRSNLPNDGYIRIYEDNNGTWQQIGNDITGSDPNFGNFYDINAAGDIVAVGQIQFTSVNGSAGGIFVYQYDGSQWNQIGQTLIGEAAGDIFGATFSLNATGNIIAAGTGENDAGGNKNGKVEVFQNISGTWTQVGQTLTGGFGDRFGARVKLNAAGNILAVGAGTGDLGANDAGQVHVYENQGGTWVQIGATIAGDQSGESFGRVINLNNAGDILVVGSPEKDINGENEVGEVKVYQNMGGNWTQIGQTLNGEQAEQAFSWFDVGINGAGNIISVPSRVNPNILGNNANMVQIFELKANVWEEIGRIRGESEESPLGGAAGLNDAGDRIAVGSLVYDQGSLTRVGRVEVYEFK